MYHELCPAQHSRASTWHRFILIILLSLSLAACSGRTVVETDEEAPTIAEVQAWQYDGPRARLVIGQIIDKTADEDDCDIGCKVGLLTGDDSELQAGDVTGGIREMLTTALFNSGRYIILEREHLEDLLTERALSVETGAIEYELEEAKLEGGELLLVGAVTDFNMGESGGVAFPVPILFNDNKNVAIIDLEFRRSRVAMDLRLIDIATGRIVAALAVEGKAWKAGAGLAGLFTTSGHIRLPGLLSVFKNTPVERAIQNMTVEATRVIVEKTPEHFLRHSTYGQD